MYKKNYMYICREFDNVIVMKKAVLISFLIMFYVASFAQNWFRDGATWTFNYQQDFTYPAHGYEKYIVVGDTIINDTTAKLINVETVRYDGYEYASGSHIMHEFGSKVSFWDGERFKLMYDLNLNVGDTLDMYSLDCGELCDSVSPFIVDNVYTRNVNGIDLKVQVISYTLYGFYEDDITYDKNITDKQIYEEITERVGSEKQFVYYPSCPDDGYLYTDLRCYNDDELSYLSYEWESLHSNIECDGLVDMHPIFNTNWIWSIGLFSHDYSISCGSYFIKLVESNSNTKYILLKSTDAYHENWTEVGIMEFRNGKVYYYSNYSVTEPILLYDFTLEEGDEFYVDELQANLVVDSVGSMTVGNRQRKTLYLSAMGEQVVWCEGIGSFNGLLKNYGNIGIADISEELLCVQNNDETVYHNPRFEECFIPANLPSTYMPSISIYPNPTSGKFRISTGGKEGRADIYDSLGRKVTSIENIANGAEIDLSGHGKGIFMVVFYANGRSYEKKVIVE